MTPNEPHITRAETVTDSLAANLAGLSGYFVFTLDQHGAFTSISPSVEKLLGFSAKECIGRRLSDWCAAARDISESRRPAASSFTFGGSPLEIMDAQGTPRILHVEMSDWLTGSSAHVFRVGIARDLTGELADRNRFQEQISILEDTLNQHIASAVSPEVVRQTVHAVNQPLTTVACLSSVLRMQLEAGTLDHDAQLRMLQQINEAAQRAADIVRELIDDSPRAARPALSRELEKLVDKAVQLSVSN